MECLLPRPGALLAVVCSCLVAAVRGADDDFVDMRVSARSTCGPPDAGDGWRLLELKADSDVPFKRDPCQLECTTTSGSVVVKELIEGPLHVFAELRLGLDRNAAPEPCHGYDRKTGCGGFGSCLYCDDTCENKELVHSTRVELRWEGEDISCLKTLDPGTYDNVELRVCMPTVGEFFDALQARGVSKGAATSLLDEENEIGFFAHLYIFGGDMRNIVLSHHRLWQFMLDHGNGKSDDKCFKSMPFIRQNIHDPKVLGGRGAKYHCRGDKNNVLPYEKWSPGYIGCQTLSGALIVPITITPPAQSRRTASWCRGRSKLPGGRKAVDRRRTSGSLRDRTRARRFMRNGR